MDFGVSTPVKDSSTLTLGRIVAGHTATNDSKCDSKILTIPQKTEPCSCVPEFGRESCGDDCYYNLNKKNQELAVDEPLRCDRELLPPRAPTLPVASPEPLRMGL